MLYYAAFLELDTERLREDGPIPWSKVVEYADDFGLIEDQRDEFIQIVMQVDVKYVDHIRDLQRKARDKQERKARRGRRGKGGKSR